MPVQRRSTGGAAPGAELAKKLAGDSLSGASGSIPYLDMIQRAFGRHDVSGVRAQVGGSAQQAAAAMGATAFAQGDRVGFAGAPDLHTAAHEAAHVVQQRGGHAPSGGLDTPGDALERHADAVADAVVAGGSAEGLLDSMGGGGTASGQDVQRKPAEKPRSAEETRQLLRRYLNANSTHVWQAVGEHLRAVQMPTPHERLTWVEYEPFVTKMLMQLETAIGKFDPISHFDEILHPTDVVRAFGGLLPQTDAWSAELGISVAQALHIAIVPSIKRLALRYLEVADSRGASGEDAVRWDELITSKPIDRYIAVALCWKRVVTVQPLDPKAAKAAKGKKTELRHVTLHFVGETDQVLWNWVRVEPADASAEEVAARIWHNTDDHGDKSASFNAYMLAAAPPLFGVPKHLAIKEPAFKRHAPQNVSIEGDNVNAQLIRIANSDAADEAAAGPQTAGKAKPQNRPELGAVLDTLRDCEMQLQAITAALGPWKLAGRIGGATAFIKRREADLNQSDADKLAQWSTVLEAQKGRLARIGGAIVSVSAAAAKLGAKPNDAQSAPMVEILELLAVAAGTSHIAQASEQKLDEALQLQATLSVRALQNTEGDMMGSLENVHQQVGDNKRTSRLSSEAVALQDRSRQLQAQMLNGQDVDADELEDVSLKSEEVAMESRLYATLEALGQINHQSLDARKGDAAIVASMFSGSFRDLPAVSKRIFDELHPAHSALMSMRENVEKELDSGTGSPKRRAELREQRRKTLQDVQAKYQKLSKDRDLEHSFFQNAAKLIENQQFRTACVKVAAMIGISIIAGAVAGVAARAVGGMLMEASGASTVAELGSVARAGIAVTRIGVDTTISSAGTAVVQGTSFTEAWKENLIVSLGTSAVFGSIGRYAAEQAEIEGRIAKTWSQASKLGKVGMVAKEVGAITAHTLWGAAMGEVANRIVTGQAAPPPSTLREWALQGVSVAVGRHISHRLMTNSKMYKALEEGAEAKGRGLVEAANKLQELAKRVISGKQPDITLQLLNEHDQFLRKEIEAVDRAITKKGDPTGELAAKRENLVAAAEVARSLGMTETKFALIGMEELIPGQMWKGSRPQIDQALAQAKQDGQNPQVISHEENLWKVKIGDREYTINETVSSAKTVDVDRVLLAGSDDGLRLAAKLVPPGPGSLDVFVHGTLDGFVVFRNGEKVSLEPRQVAEFIKKQGLKFKKIRLLACNSGGHPKGAAQHLANKLGVPVEAPTDKLWIHPDGTLTIGPVPNRNTGKWIEYEPQPSETRYTKAPETAHEAEQPTSPGTATPSRAIDLGSNPHRAERSRRLRRRSTSKRRDDSMLRTSNRSSRRSRSSLAAARFPSKRKLRSGARRITRARSGTSATRYAARSPTRLRAKICREASRRSTARPARTRVAMRSRLRVSRATSYTQRGSANQGSCSTRLPARLTCSRISSTTCARASACGADRIRR